MPYPYNSFNYGQPYPGYQNQQPVYQGGIQWGTYEEACSYPLAPNMAITMPEPATKEDVASLAAAINALQEMIKGGTDNA